MDDLLERNSSLNNVKALLLERTAGNPLFIEESVRALIDSGAITRSRGKFTLAQRIEGIRIPFTIQSIMAARIDLLSSRDKSILQSASVIGTVVSATLLSDVIDEPSHVVLACLERLSLAGFFEVAKSASEPDYLFKHPLIHEVAYSSILKSQRGALHRRILASIERIYASRLSEFAQILAEHARRGELWEKCAFYLRQTALSAYRRSANAEATRFLEQALEVLALAPSSREVVELQVDLCFDLRNSLLLIGELRKILVYLARAEAAANELQDDRRLARLASYMSHAYWATGDTRRALHHGTIALTFAQRSGARALVMPARYHVALVLSDLGQYDELNRRLIDLVDGLTGEERHERFGLNAPLAVLAASYLTRSLAEVGDFDLARAHAERGLRVAQEIDEPFAKAMMRLALGYAFLVQGDIGPATDNLAQASDLFAALANKTMFTVANAFLGRARLLDHGDDQALKLLDDAVTAADSIGLMSHQPLRLAMLADGYRALSRKQSALIWSEQAIRLAKQQRERGSEAYALWVRGRVLADGEGDAPRQAGLQFAKALAIANSRNMRPIAALCRLGLAKYYQSCGKSGASQRQLATAIPEFQRMNMPHWAREAGLVSRGRRLPAVD